MYFLTIDSVVLSPTVPIYHPSLQYSLPHNCFLNAGYSENICRALMLLTTCIILEGDYFGAAPTKTYTWSLSVPISSNSNQYLSPISYNMALKLSI
jgi:hypothetical protein